MASHEVGPTPDTSELPPSETRSTAPAPDPTPLEPPTQTGNFIHGLIGLSHGGFSETVRNSFSSLTRTKDPDALALSNLPSTTGTNTITKPDDAKDLSTTPSRPEPQPLHLLTLPEILLLILNRLPFADIVRLRRTCKQLRTFASPHQIRVLLGPDELRAQLLGHCKSCLRHDPFRSNLLQPTLADPGYPLASTCLDCAVRDRDPRIKVGKIINLANFDSVHVLLVFAPTVTNFLLLWICLGFLILRGNRFRTYHWTLSLELVILGLWVAPVYHIAREIVQASSAGDTVSKATKATQAMFCLNM
ncbi:hypothetical protein N0V88_007128 [Collariella sp. IMI 366227]|nr:hypothetical protein N0V88_007128 [Collariella sp. IMI 366227]